MLLRSSVFGLALCVFFISNSRASESLVILGFAVDPWSPHPERVESDERVSQLAPLVRADLIARGHSAMSFSTDALRAQSANGYLLAHPQSLSQVADLVSARWATIGKVRRVSAFEVWIESHLIDTYTRRVVGRAEVVLPSASANPQLTEGAARSLAIQIDTLMNDIDEIRDRTTALCSGRARADRRNRIRCDRSWSPPGAYHATLWHHQ